MLLSTITISILLPYQVHPSTLDGWQVSIYPIVTATIDTSRIIGLPRLKALDKQMYRVFYMNEFNFEVKYKMQSRKELIHNYFSR